MKNKASISWEEFISEELADPQDAFEYLQLALEEYQADHDSKSLNRVLRDIANSQGGLSSLATKTGLNRESLYKTLSAKGNPRLETFDTILTALGFRLTVERIPQAQATEQ